MVRLCKRFVAPAVEFSDVLGSRRILQIAALNTGQGMVRTDDLLTDSEMYDTLSYQLDNAAIGLRSLSVCIVLWLYSSSEYVAS